MKTKTLLAAAAAALALASSAGAQNAPPALNLTLAPHQSGGAVDKVGVTLKLQAPDAKPGEPFLRLPMVFASVETQRYEAAQIEVTDAKGAVPLVQKDDPVDQANFMYFRRWQVARPTQGDVTVRYTANAAAFRPKLGSGPPFDLRAAGVDFAASSSYKWLMGDFGLGFLYVRKEIQDKVKRPWWGYHQVNAFKSHVFPYDEPGPGAATYGMSPDAAGTFAMGTTSWTGVVQLDYSLGLIKDLGVPAIEAARQPLIKAIQTELRGRGYQPMTPLDSRTALVAFALKDARAKLGDLMKAANIRITVSQNRFRVSLAVFNDMNDVDRLLSALPRTPPA